MQPLPERVSRLLHDLGAPPRLVVHSALVHDVAYHLVESLALLWPALRIDREVVFLGAAAHDVGKAVHRDELTGPGTQHEVLGPVLLRAHGFPEAVARIARTHGQWAADSSLALEDLLVALADTVWKGRRDGQLEQLIVRRLTAASQQDQWAVYARLDDLLTTIADDAEDRFRWHASQPA